MRLMIIAAGAAVLGLAACNQEEEAPAMDETVAAEDVAVDTAGTESMAPEGAPAADSAMQDSAVPPADMSAPGPGPVTDETRANAQAEAESTNLHPRTE